MRIATYNVEWFTNLFAENGNLLEDKHWSGRYDVKRDEQLAALGVVFSAMNADVVLVVEAPDTNKKRTTERALEKFADRFELRTRKALIGFANHTQQEIALLYDPDVVDVKHDPQGKPTGKKGAHGAPRFDGAFRQNKKGDADPEIVTFSKPPLEALVHTKTGKKFRLIGVHIKSKAPHGARGKDDLMRISIHNRRKQLAQCIWLRNRVEQHLSAGESLIVLGDFNDGPGLDEYEKLFGRSGIEIVLGEGDGPNLFDPHAEQALSPQTARKPVTSRFYISHQERYLQALLDYVMVSDDLRRANAIWRIWHPFDDAAIDKTPKLRDALLAASDHFPVTLDVDI